MKTVLFALLILNTDERIPFFCGGGPDATYACINYNEAYAPDEIRSKSICINGDVGDILNKLK
jgi:hypothetical protein